MQDDVIQSYVVGDPDPYYPGSKVTLSEITSVFRPVSNLTPDEAIELAKADPFGAIIDTSGDQQIYPEDLQPYLSVVEWYIQKVCCEKIGEEMRPKVFGLYKRVLLNAYYPASQGG